jgi:hypothetical protein
MRLPYYTGIFSFFLDNKGTEKKGRAFTLLIGYTIRIHVQLTIKYDTHESHHLINCTGDVWVTETRHASPASIAPTEIVPSLLPMASSL